MNRASRSFDTRLDIPATWIDELCQDRNPDLFSPVSGSELPERISLSFGSTLPQWLTKDQISFDDVVQDLSAGMSLERWRDKKGDLRFCLNGTIYSVNLVSKERKDTKKPIALVTSIRRAEGLPRRSRVFTRPITFSPISNQRPCDLEKIGEAMRVLDKIEEQAVLTLAHPHPQVELRNHNQLHAAAARQYGALNSLMELLEQHANVEQAASASCVIIEAHVDADADSRRRIAEDEDNYLAVRIKRCSGTFEEDSNVEVVSDSGEVSRTRLRELDADIALLEMPEGMRSKPGDMVTLRAIPRFSMRQHSRSLQQFLREEVEGSWADLTRLLCRPGTLELPPHSPPDRFFCDEDPEEQNRRLNDRQRQAVTAALATPHAFFIQGPPGTGKTTVISELVRQLIDRGERVLLLAPTHVAVDEVLRRVGHKDGVLALRLSWDDTKVRKELRCFTLSEARAQFVRNIRRPSTSRARQWDREHQRLTAERACIKRLLGALERFSHTAATLDNAMAVEAAARGRLVDWQMTVRQQSQDTEASIAQLTSLFATSEADCHRAREAKAEAEADLHGDLEKVTHLLQVTRTLRQAVQAWEEAAVQLKEWRLHYETECRSVSSDLETTDRQLAAATAELDRTVESISGAEEQLGEAIRKQSRFDKVIGLIRLGDVASKTKALKDHMSERQRLESRIQDLKYDHQELNKRQQRLAEEGPRQQAALEQGLERARVTLNEAKRTWRASEDAWTKAFGSLTDPLAFPPEELASLINRLEQAIREPIRGGDLLKELGDQLAGHYRRYEERSQSMEIAELARRDVETRLRECTERHERLTVEGPAQEQELQAALAAATREREQSQHEHAAVEQERIEATKAMQHRMPASPCELSRHEQELDCQLQALERYPELEHRWFEITGMAEEDEGGADQIVRQIGDDLLRAANLICATTTGIAGRGSEIARGADFDTLIVDEASRVTDSEFLIGAIRARRWILVGDEKQLPPFVDATDEYHLHALAALHRVDRGSAPDPETAVSELGAIWKEDEELRQFRERSVLAVAQKILDSGDWEAVYRETFVKAHAFFQRLGNDADRKLLETMRRYLVRSLFERCVLKCRPEMRQRLSVQRRMIAPIAAIVRDVIYQGEYETPSAADLKMCGVIPLGIPAFHDRPVVFLDTSIQPTGKSGEQIVGNGFVNDMECGWVVSACRAYEQVLRSRNESQVTVSILCFYRAQALEIRQRLKAPVCPGFEKLRFEVIDAIDRIQGQESDLVFLSFCRTHGGRPGPQFGQWLQDLRRLNVACTRAHRGLVLVGHGQTLSKLCAFPKAQEFYANLLALFERQSPASSDYIRIMDYK